MNEPWLTNPKVEIYLDPAYLALMKEATPEERITILGPISTALGEAFYSSIFQAEDQGPWYVRVTASADGPDPTDQLNLGGYFVTSECAGVGHVAFFYVDEAGEAQIYM